MTPPPPPRQRQVGPKDMPRTRSERLACKRAHAEAMFEVDHLKRQLEAVAVAIEEAVAREEELLPLATICRRFDREAYEQREANRRKLASGKYTIIDLFQTH